MASKPGKVRARRAIKADKKVLHPHKKTHHHVSVIRVKQAKQILLFSVILFITGAAMLTYALIEDDTPSRIVEAPNTVDFDNADAQYATIESKLGFSFRYNTVFDSAEATIMNNGGVVAQPQDEKLAVDWQTKAYNSVTLKPQDNGSVDAASIKDIDTSTFTVEVLKPALIKEITAQSTGKDPRIAVIEQYAPRALNTTAMQYESELQSIADVTLGGNVYKEAIFSQNVDLAGLIDETTSYSQKQYMYVTEQYGNIYLITASNIRIGASDDSFERYTSYIESLTFTKPTAQLALADTSSVLGVNTDTLPVAAGGIFGSQFASIFSPAQAQAEDPSSADTVTLYEPATVRIANVFCIEGTLTIEGVAEIPPTCTGGAGTGFIISEDGYVGSNGHVSVISPRDVIADSLSIGDEIIIKALATALTDGINVDATAQRIASDEALRNDLVAYLLYFVDDYRLEVKKEVQHIAVELGESTFKMNESLEDPFTNDVFIYGDGVAKAKLVSSDYNPVDPLTKLSTLGAKFTEKDFTYTASDVALLKLEEQIKYPTVKLGSIDSITSGDEILILGYPGVADNGSLVSQEKSTPTATTGIVSAIRDAVGTNNKLIQTDTTIDRGNSGGPAFNKAGEVIGLATYGASSTFGGEFNYIRDIKDFIALAEKEGVDIESGSEVQDLWVAGLDKYNQRYFTPAIKDFEKVLELYPAHSQAAALITKAKERIANGEEAKNMSAIVLPLAAFLAVAGGIGGVVAVLLHSKHKHAARAAIAGMAPQTGVAPMNPAGPMQFTAPQPTVYAPQQPLQQPVQTNTVMSPSQPAAPQSPVPVQPVGVVQPPQPQQPVPPNQQPPFQQ